jgi:phosphoribosylaminoimidazolecarboxamide formyltransferase / IMP cyclohydrolase
MTAPGWPRAALLSVSDKTGLAMLARELADHGTRIIASGGTARHLEEAGVPVTAVETWTGSPEMLGGRVKTLHPHVHGPILARRSEPADLATLTERGLTPIDLVAVTLYPFETRAAGLDDAGMIEEIDIGGVALLRAAAKNHHDVTVLHDPSQYGDALTAFAAGGPTPEQRRVWAIAAFARTARYDGAIAAELARRADPAAPPPVHVVVLERVRGLRYGENPHQTAALYVRAGAGRGLTAAREGKELSYNNLVDLHAAVTLAGRFAAPTCVIVKHNEPCGIASAADSLAAYDAALAGDPQSAFGGIVAFNSVLDGASAERMSSQFVECVAAPEFAPAALLQFEKKKNLRVVRIAAQEIADADPWSVRGLGSWALLEREDSTPAPEWRVVTQRPPAAEERTALEFAWTVAAAARSNAITLARGTRLIGLGSGQTSRVDAVDVALMKARRAGHDLRGAVLASDGFFPFADNVDHAAEAGITAIVQPGGSVRDAEVIAAADRHRIAMCFTDRRVFRH